MKNLSGDTEHYQFDLLFYVFTIEETVITCVVLQSQYYKRKLLLDLTVAYFIYSFKESSNIEVAKEDLRITIHLTAQLATFEYISVSIYSVTEMLLDDFKKLIICFSFFLLPFLTMQFGVKQN